MMNVEHRTSNVERRMEFTREDLLPFCGWQAGVREPWIEWNYRGDGTETGDRKLRASLSDAAYAQHHYDTLCTDARVLLRLPSTRVPWVQDGDAMATRPPAIPHMLYQLLHRAATQPGDLDIEWLDLPAPRYEFTGEFLPADWSPDQTEFEPEDYNLAPTEVVEAVALPGFACYAASNYLRKLARCLRGVRFVCCKGRSELDPIPFVFEGGQGLLMPYRASEEQRAAAASGKGAAA